MQQPKPEPSSNKNNDLSPITKGEEVLARSKQVPEKIRANFKIFDEYFDIGYSASLIIKVLNNINKYYFRTKFVGFDDEDFPPRNNPERPLIFASNHSGMAFPWDAIVLSSALLERKDYDMGKVVRAITSPMLSKTRFMSPFLLKDFWKQNGAIDATRLNFETMMYYNKTHILIYPEGVPGIGKGFNNKYRLQKLSTSALRMSIKYETDIIPFATVNAEYINPLSYSFDKLNRIVNKIGIPFLPIGPMLLFILAQPWMFYFALPAKLTYVRGRRIQPYKMTDKAYEDMEDSDFQKLRDVIHQQMQEELDSAVKEYGKKPYDLKELFKTVYSNMDKFFSFFPAVWPLLFKKHLDNYKHIQKVLHDECKENLSDNEKVAFIKKYYDKEGNRQVNLWDLIKTVFRHPDILLLYTPILGLVTMFSQQKK